jgi:serine/threonine-protein kinase RsbW
LTVGLPNLRLDLANRAENVLLVREMLTGLAEAVGLAGDELHDAKTAVTEACNNVVLHAYGGGEGPLEVEVYVAPSAIEAVVRDYGSGIRPLIRTGEETGVGLGLPMIQALAHSVEFVGAIGDGTEVRMRFATPGILAPEANRADALPSHTATSHADASLTIAPAALARTVLPRLLSALGARAHFSTDRISDTQLLADALAAHGSGSSGEAALSVAIEVKRRDLQLRVGPLRAGRARQLIDDSAVAGLRPVLESLSDRQAVRTWAESEMLLLRLTESR